MINAKKISKKMIMAAVALAITNANAVEVDGFEITGGASAAYQYTNKSSKSGNVTNKEKDHEIGLNSIRFGVNKDFGNGLSVYGQVDANESVDVNKENNTEVVLNALSLDYKNNEISFSIGKNYYGFYTFSDKVDDYRSATNFLGSESVIPGNYVYGASLGYAPTKELSINLSGGKFGDLLYSKKDTKSNNSKLSSNVFGGKEAKLFAARLDYTFNNITFGAGYQRVSDAKFLNGDKNSANSFAVDGTYVAGGVFTNISYTNSSLRKDKTNEVEATALFGLYGKGAFDNAGSLVKATDFVYGGLNASYSKEGDEKGTDVGVVLGYAANPTLKVYAEYSFGKREETGMKANVNTVNITTKLSF